MDDSLALFENEVIWLFILKLILVNAPSLLLILKYDFFEFANSLLILLPIVNPNPTYFVVKFFN